MYALNDNLDLHISDLPKGVFYRLQKVIQFGSDLPLVKI
jgi:hypothetical protein